MQPGRTATFLRTTAAKKISTNQFRQGELEDSLAGLGSKSLKYESIVSLPHNQPPITSMQLSTISLGSGGQQPYVTSSSAAAQSTQQTLQNLGSASGQQTNLGFPSFLGPGAVSASAQSSLGLPTASLAANNLPSSPYIFRSSNNQSEARQQLLSSGAVEFEQPFAARLRSEEGKARLEEEEEDEDKDEEEDGGVAEIVREMEASHLRLPGGYQAHPPMGAYHLAPLPSGSFQSGPPSYQLSPATYHPGPTSHQSIPAVQSHQPSPSSFHPSSTTHQGSSESYQPLSPPSYQPPPSISKHQQQEDIKVIHFGVV